MEEMIKNNTNHIPQIDSSLIENEDTDEIKVVSVKRITLFI